MAGRRTYRARAVVLDRTKLGESDLILTLLSQAGEQLRAVAKGARKPGGRLAARTELFCETDFLLARGRNLDVVSEAGLVDAHDALRTSYERTTAASVVAEVARLTSFEGSEDGWLYPVCARALAACEEADDQPHLDLVCAAFAFKVLAHQGWRPELRGCAACGEPAADYFSASAGGVLCSSCAHEVAGARELGEGRLAWARALLSLTFDELLAAPVDGPTASFLLALAHDWAATHLECRLRALEFALGL